MQCQVSAPFNVKINKDNFFSNEKLFLVGVGYLQVNASALKDWINYNTHYEVYMGMRKLFKTSGNSIKTP